MSKVKNAKRKARMARGGVDKAQSSLILANSKRLAALEASVEKKYNYAWGTELGIESLDMSTPASRTRGITPVRIGTTQGTSDVDSRVGDMVNLKSILFKYNVQILNGASTPAEPINRVRVIVFWDNDPVIPNAAGTYVSNPPEWQQLLQSVRITSGAADPSVVLSPYDHDKRNRFNFLYDEVHTLTPILNSNGGAGVALGLGSRSATNSNGFTKSYKQGRKLRYTGGGLIPNNRQLYIAWISTVNTGYPSPQINFSIKTLYEDA
jgi:hypothetical protein